MNKDNYPYICLYRLKFNSSRIHRYASSAQRNIAHMHPHHIPHGALPLLLAPTPTIHSHLCIPCINLKLAIQYNTIVSTDWCWHQQLPPTDIFATSPGIINCNITTLWSPHSREQVLKYIHCIVRKIFVLLDTKYTKRYTVPTQSPNNNETYAIYNNQHKNKQKYYQTKARQHLSPHFLVCANTTFWPSQITSSDPDQHRPIDTLQRILSFLAGTQTLLHTSGISISQHWLRLIKVSHGLLFTSLESLSQYKRAPTLRWENKTILVK